MRLIGVEFRRFWSRRLVWGSIAAGAVGIVAYGVVVFLTHSPEAPTAESVAVQVENQAQGCRRSAVQEYERELEFAGQQDPEYGEYLSQFATAEEYADERCDPRNMGFYVQDPRFCLVALWEPHQTYRETCPDLVVGQQTSDIFSRELAGYVEETYPVVVGGETFRSPDGATAAPFHG